MSVIAEILKGLRKLEQTKEPQQNLQEGKTYSIDKKTNVRLDPPSHGEGQHHAHINRRGTPERIMNKDGTSSHDTGPFTINDKEAKFLSGKGYAIPMNN